MSVLTQSLNVNLATGDLTPLDGLALPVADDPMPTLIVSALFTNARASAEEAKQAGLDVNALGGYFGDVFFEKSVGSKLWLLAREQNIPDTWSKARTYCDAALAHLIGRYASAISVATGYKGVSQMYIEVSYIRPDGSRNTVTETYNFAA